MHSKSVLGRWARGQGVSSFVGMMLALSMGIACGPHVGGGDGDGGVGDGTTGDGRVDASGSECKTNDDCNGGYCVGGYCCPTREQVCGEACCGRTQVCYANACLTPGKICHSTADCNEGQYCEFGLGDDDGGVADAGVGDGSVCLHAAPSGRCVDLPPRCDEGGQPDGGICLPDCEYHPPAGGPLTARMKWRWGPEATEYGNFTDVWSTPAVGRVYDTNCDGVVDALDPPNIIFVSGNAEGTCCQCTGRSPSRCRDGVLRMLDGLTGQEIWSVRSAYSGSMGFAGLSVAIGDVIRGAEDRYLEIVAATGEGDLVILDRLGNLVARSDQPIHGGNLTDGFGWGGGIALGDMDGDGFVEVAYGKSVYTTAGGGLTLLFEGTAGVGRSWSQALSVLSDVDGDGQLELVAGQTAYKIDGSILWNRDDIGDGFVAVADMDQDGAADVVLVQSGKVYLLDGSSGQTKLGPAVLPSNGFGGPPTVADFDGDGHPEIGVAQKEFYAVLKPDFGNGALDILWQAPNHDLSSSVTGSTVFDFEGDGAAEVVYNDECFLWVYDGATGAIRFATPTTSFTATESSLLADVDGDGHAEMVMIANGADPSSSGWKCDMAPWNQDDPNSVRPAWQPPPGETAWRGIAVFGDTANSWVSTRTLWNQHSYHVTNICDDRDDACDPPNVYGGIPAHEKPNWTVTWLNNFRQNVQDQGLFDAPDATVILVADCTDPVVLHGFVRNLGAAILPAGVSVGFYVHRSDTDTLLTTMQTTTALFPGQTEELVYETTPADAVTSDDEFIARIEVDPNNPTFHECRDDNNETAPTKPNCSVVR